VSVATFKMLVDTCGIGDKVGQRCFKLSNETYRGAFITVVQWFSTFAPIFFCKKKLQSQKLPNLHLYKKGARKMLEKLAMNRTAYLE